MGRVCEGGFRLSLALVSGGFGRFGKEKVGVREGGSPGAGRGSSRGVLWAALLFLWAGVLYSSGSSAQIRGTIVGPGLSRYPIAVAPLRASGDEEASVLGESFSRVLGRDLELSGYFRVIDRRAYLEDPATSGITSEQIDFRAWSLIGALGLVKGMAELSGDDLRVEVRFFDVDKQRMLGGKRYRGTREDWRRMAHKFADQIMYFMTGERGPFDSRLVFSSRRGSRFKELYVMSVEGDDLKRLTRDDNIALSPSWHPSGYRVLFTSYRQGNPNLFEISLDGAVRRLSGRRGLNLGGRWSPDGSVIAAALEGGGGTEIVLLDEEGGLRKRLTENSHIDVSPSWSPDGTQLVFCSNRAGSPQLYVMNADGSAVRRLTFSGDYNTSPAWSPKGDLIAYVSRVAGRFHVFVIPASGGAPRRITTEGNNEDPTWSPDGRYLAFSSTRGGGRAIYLSDLSGRVQSRLTPEGGDDSAPAWSAWLE